MLQSPRVAGAKTAVLLSASQKTLPVGQHEVVKASEEQDAKRHPTTWTTQGPRRATDPRCVNKKKKQGNAHKEGEKLQCKMLCMRTLWCAEGETQARANEFKVIHPEGRPNNR